MAQTLRTTVHRKMLGTSRGFQVSGIFSLKSFHKGYPQSGSQKWIFTVSFLAAPPPGVTENIDVRCPKGESIVSVVITLFQ